MSRESYKRLGDYIKQVDVRNSDLAITNLVGLTIDKKFIASVANTVGTDFSNYKIIKKGQFACSLMQVSRDGRIPIAMFPDNIAIMSPAYPMFEVEDTSRLLPEYLMMWFSRNEFDREASFYAVGGVRGSLEWADFLNMRLPVPSIDEQRHIVEQYQSVERRIKSNERLIASLETTAEALYYKMFVNDIDNENLPKGWKRGTLYELCDSISGGDWGKDKSIDSYSSEVYCVRGTDIPFVAKGNKSTMPKRYILSKNLNSKRLLEDNIVVEISGGTPTQSTGRSLYVSNYLLEYLSNPLICSNFCKKIIGKKHYGIFIYATLKNFYYRRLMFKYENSSNGINNLDLESLLSKEKILIPSINDSLYFSSNYRDILKQITILGIENEILKELQSLLLANMGQ